LYSIPLNLDPIEEVSNSSEQSLTGEVGPGHYDACH